MRLKTLVPLLALACALPEGLRAQIEPLNVPAPLTRAANPAALSPGSAAVTLMAAQRAQELGLPTIAEQEYRKLFDVPGADRAGLTLALATVLLDAGNGAEAEKVLNTFTGARGSAWQLRAGLAAAQQKKMDAARAALAASKLDELGGGDKPWWYFLSGLVAEAVNDWPHANDLFDQAEKTASTELTRARFMIATTRVRLMRNATVDDAQIRQARDTYNRFRTQPVGYDYARTLAVMLSASKQPPQRDEAVPFLQGVLGALPTGERERADEFRLLLGMIAGMGREDAGRRALMQLLEQGVNTDKQRMALAMLAASSDNEPRRVGFRAELDKLIGAPTAHPILDSLLLYRAQSALGEKTSEGYAQAERDAKELGAKFPGSPLRVRAFGVLTASAWEQKRYRTAADNAALARAELAKATQADEVAARAKLGVLEAEARFRAGEAAGAAGAGDYRAAADAYAAALKERPADVRASDLVFQRVIAEIRAGASDKAEPLLDEAARDPALQAPSDLENRWQAEWNLARALQVERKTAAAYARVNRLLASAPAGTPQIKPDLRARMVWLQARLSFDAGQPKETIDLAAKIAGSLAGLTDATLRDEIVSSTTLLTAEAQFKLGDEASALKSLQKVRDEFKKSDAAVYSYIIEANYYANQNQAAKALKLFRDLADQFDKNTYAPYALFQAALQSERLGQDKNYEEAIEIIERLVTKYPQSELVFAARLKEGDLMRRLTWFQRAQLIYEGAINAFPRHADVVYAKLALAETHNALAQGETAADRMHVAEAKSLFEQLRDRVDAPVDVRVEAGYNLGALVARSDPKKALDVWWHDVVQPFLLDDPTSKATVLDQSSTARHWMALTLLKAAELFEKQLELEQAQRAWRLIIEAKLPGDTIARTRLERFKLPEAKAPEAKP